MDKRRLHHLYTRLRAVKPWYLLALAAIAGLVCLGGLRANNEHMLRLRNQVFAADKSGVGVEGALINLRDFVSAHMNTNLSAGSGSVYPPIQLKYTYQRLLDQQYLSYAQSNGGLYTAAQAYCQKLDPTDFSGHNRLPCIEQYVLGHSSVSIGQVPASLYEFDFISPSWSPDLAGWSLVVTILLLIASAVLFGLRLGLKRATK